jgi:hypothetical protein
MADTTGPVALDTQDLRSRLRRRMTRTTAACVACVVLAVASAAILSAVDAHLSAEQAKFDRYRGDIVAVYHDGGDSDRGSVSVEFTQNGRDRTADIDIDNTASFSEGPATVLVDPHDPNFVTLPGENYFDAGEGLAVLLIGGFGVAAICFGAIAGITRRNFDILASSTWTTVSGFVVKVKNKKRGEGDWTRWVLFLPEHEGGSFWVFRKALPMPKFTGSVAIDGRGRLVHRVADGKRLAYASRSWPTGPWSRHRVTEATRLGDWFTFRYGVDDQPHRCTVQVAGTDDDTATTLTNTAVVDLLSGPYGSAAVNVPRVGVIGVGEASEQTTPWRPNRLVGRRLRSEPQPPTGTR